MNNNKYMNNNTDDKNVEDSESLFKKIKKEYGARASELYDFLADKASKVSEYFKRGPYEIFYMGALGGFVALTLSYKHESNKNHTIPLAFSETSKIERTAKSMGIEVPVMTDYLSKTNDLCMNVFEAWNQSWENTWIDNHTRNFAEEMDVKTDPTFKIYHYEIPQLSKIVPQRADSLLKELVNLREMSKNVGYANNYLDKTWNDSHDDVYHTEYYEEEETYTDSDGETHTQTVTKSRQVYDYTINEYIYFKTYGENSSKKLDDIIQWFPKLPLEVKLIITKETEADNEYAIEKSRKLHLDGKPLSPEEFLKMSQSWAYGSQIYRDQRILLGLCNNLKGNADEWRVAKKTAKSDRIITYNYSHAEPKEFLVVEKTLDNGKTFVNTTDNLLQTISYTRKNVPVLEQKINELVQVELLGKEGDADDLKDEIMNLSKDIYYKNFPKGFDVNQGNYGITALFTFLGLMLGAAAGYGLDVADEKYKIYDRIIKKIKSVN